MTDGYHLWSKTFDRELRDVFAVQDEISHAIADDLKVTLVGSGQTPLVKAPMDNLEAYELYLKGRFHFNKWNEESFHTGIRYFEQAIEQDPEYALAYAGLADTYVGLVNFSPPDEVFPKARAAAEQALALDSSLAEAHLALGMVEMCDWRLEAAERRFHEAVARNPGFSLARVMRTNNLLALGRIGDATVEARQAGRLDPLSPLATCMDGFVCYHARRYEAAAAGFQATLQLEPNFAQMREMLGLAYLRLGEEERGLTELQEAVERSGRSQLSLALLALGQAVAGRREDALRTLAEVQSRLPDSYVSPSFIAAAYAELGEAEEALDWLEKGVAARDVEMLFVAVDPAFDNLRDEPRFAALIKRVGVRPPTRQTRGSCGGDAGQ